MKKVSLVFAFLGVACAGESNGSVCRDGLCSVATTEQGIVRAHATDSNGRAIGDLTIDRASSTGTWTPVRGNPGEVRGALDATAAAQAALSLARIQPNPEAFTTCSTAVDENGDSLYEPCQEFSVDGFSCMACVTLQGDCSASVRTVCAGR